MGLGSDVVKLAMVGGFKHMLYISCGREALKRDLEVLLEKRKEKVKGGGGWKVEDVTFTDLFPRTDSVETLVHLVWEEEEGEGGLE